MKTKSGMLTIAFRMGEEKAETLLSVMETENGNCEAREVKEATAIVIRAIRRAMFVATYKKP
jgi:hypothetical protein